LPAAPFAAWPLLPLFFVALCHALPHNMVGGRLRGQTDQQRYRKCGTGKPLHPFFPKQ
jgi:hypothetical protein